MPDFFHLIPIKNVADLEYLNYFLTAGRFLWALAYLAIAVAGFRARSYGMPLVACCLTLSWELIFSFIYVCQGWPLFWFKLWFYLDCLIFLEIVVFGKAWQRNPVIRSCFYFVLATTAIFAFIGERTYFNYVATPNNCTDYSTTMVNMAYMINLVASILFSFLLFSRPALAGLSYLAAWAKSIGTLLISIANVISLQYIPGMTETAAADQWLYPEYFLYFLMFTVTFYDVIYITLFTRAKFFGRHPGAEENVE